MSLCPNCKLDARLGARFCARCGFEVKPTFGRGVKIAFAVAVGVAISTALAWWLLVEKQETCVTFDSPAREVTLPPSESGTSPVSAKPTRAGRVPDRFGLLSANRVIFVIDPTCLDAAKFPDVRGDIASMINCVSSWQVFTVVTAGQVTRLTLRYGGTPVERDKAIQWLAGEAKRGPGTPDIEAGLREAFDLGADRVVLIYNDSSWLGEPGALKQRIGANCRLDLVAVGKPSQSDQAQRLANACGGRYYTCD